MAGKIDEGMRLWLLQLVWSNLNTSVILFFA